MDRQKKRERVKKKFTKREVVYRGKLFTEGSCLQREVIYKEKLLDNLIRCYKE